MIKNTIQLIKMLTGRDSKNLSQKGLKLSEECGELSKNILPYEGAAGTLHKFVHKEKIAENCVDTILVALSIAYSLGYSDDELAAIMMKKTLYWSALQDNEKNVDMSKMPHELHLTVKSVDKLETFICACNTAGVKPIILDLHTKSGCQLKDMMTSSVYIGSSSDAYKEMSRIKSTLEVYGLQVIRGKIEAPPFHPSVPNANNKFQHEKNRYFETHIEVILDLQKPELMNDLKSWAEKRGDIHLSANTFKRDSGVSTVMLTFRSDKYIMETFKQEVHLIRTELTNSGFTLNGKEIIEYCLYDSATSHDNEWLFGK